jgi:hypothetical protein
MSDDGQPPEILKTWIRVERALRLLAQWDGARGLLFVGASPRAEPFARAAFDWLAPEARIECGPETHSKQAFSDATEIAYKQQRQGSLLEPPTPERIGIFVNDVDRCPEWLQLRLKSIFERSGKSVCIVGTATDESAHVDYLRGHFLVTKHRGRLPKRADE